MAYKWEIVKQTGSLAIGFVDVYKTNLGFKVKTIVTYLPQFGNKNQSVVLTILLQGEEKFWTEGKIKAIFHDMEEIIKNLEPNRFENLNSLDYMFTQVFYLDDIENFKYITHGDQSFI